MKQTSSKISNNCWDQKGRLMLIANRFSRRICPNDTNSFRDNVPPLSKKTAYVSPNTRPSPVNMTIFGYYSTSKRIHRMPTEHNMHICLIPQEPSHAPSTWPREHRGHLRKFLSALHSLNLVGGSLSPDTLINKEQDNNSQLCKDEVEDIFEDKLLGILLLESSSN